MEISLTFSGTEFSCFSLLFLAVATGFQKRKTPDIPPLMIMLQT